MSEKKWTYNLFVVCATELFVMLFGMKIIRVVYANVVHPLVSVIQDTKLQEFWFWGGYLVLFLIPIAAILIYMRATDRAVLPAFALKKGSGRAFAIGSLAGLAMNLLCSLLAAATGCFSLSFSGFSLLVLPQVLFGFFSCSCEELLCRGYVQEYLKKLYPLEVAAAAGSVLFIFHHISNMQSCGFNQYFALNVFLIGLVFVLVMELTGSIWAAFGMHTLWNFNQQFILGLPNSGASSSLSIFNAGGAVDGFFFNTTYGLEGAPGTTVVSLAVLALLYKLYKKQRAAVHA